jgi:hypothetical protein
VAAIRSKAGEACDLDQASVVTDQETGPSEVRCQPEGTVEPPSEHVLGFRRAVGEE